MLNIAISRKSANIAAALAFIASVSFTIDQSIARQAAKTLPRAQAAISSFAILEFPSTQIDRAPRRKIVAPAQFFTINAVISKQTSDLVQDEIRPIKRSGALTNFDEHGMALRGAEPFGLFAFRAPEGPLWDKWRDVSQAIDADFTAIKMCQADSEACSLESARFLKVLDESRAVSGRSRLEVVNTRINSIIRYQEDVAQHGMPDRWSAPLTTLASGHGDCEDYAFAKYVALREIGVSPADLQIVLAQDIVVNQAHAVLAVKEEGRWLLLDNRRPQIYESDGAQHLAPRFAIDHNGVKLFAIPYASNSYTP